MLLKFDLTCPALPFLEVEMVSSSTAAPFMGHNHKPSFTSSYDLRKEVCAPFAWSCRSLHIKSVLFLVIIQKLGHKFCSNPRNAQMFKLKYVSICHMIRLEC
jgi:hypothetical protein